VVAQLFSPSLLLQLTERYRVQNLCI